MHVWWIERESCRQNSEKFWIGEKKRIRDRQIGASNILLMFFSLAGWKLYGCSFIFNFYNLTKKSITILYLWIISYFQFLKLRVFSMLSTDLSPSADTLQWWLSREIYYNPHHYGLPNFHHKNNGLTTKYSIIASHFWLFFYQSGIKLQTQIPHLNA